MCFTINDVNVLEQSSDSLARDISEEKELSLTKEIINYLLKNPYDEGGEEVNPSNKDLLCGLDS